MLLLNACWLDHILARCVKGICSTDQGGYSTAVLQVVKGRGASVEFYKFYADLTQQLQGLISQNALALPPAAVAHQAALMTGQQNTQGLGLGGGAPGRLGRDKSLAMQNALESVHL